MKFSEILDLSAGPGAQLNSYQALLSSPFIPPESSPSSLRPSARSGHRTSAPTSGRAGAAAVRRRIRVDPGASRSPRLPRHFRPGRSSSALFPSRSPLVRLCASAATASAAPAHFSASAAAAARDLRGVATGLAPRHCSRFSLALEAASGGDPPAAVPLRASVLASSTSPRVLEKRPRPGNGASRFQRWVNGRGPGTAHAQRLAAAPPPPNPGLCGC